RHDGQAGLLVAQDRGHEQHRVLQRAPAHLGGDQRRAPEGLRGLDRRGGLDVEQVAHARLLWKRTRCRPSKCHSRTRRFERARPPRTSTLSSVKSVNSPPCRTPNSKATTACSERETGSRNSARKFGKLARSQASDARRTSDSSRRALMTQKGSSG